MSIERMRIIAAISYCFLLIFLPPSFGSSTRMQSLDSIMLQTEAFIQQYPYQTPYPARFKINKLDSRLRVKACNSPLIVNFSNPERIKGNTSLKILCLSPVKWHIFMPAKIDLYDDVLVAAKPLFKGQPIDASDYKYAKTKVSSLYSGYMKSSSELKDLVIKRNIKRGEVLSHANLNPNLIVKTGQKVTILLKFKGLSIKSTGIALQSAQKGQTIRVRNTQSRKIVEGIVSAQGQIMVSL